MCVSCVELLDCVNPKPLQNIIMKVGILTLELCANYGGVLQAFALYRTLEKMGHEPWLISTKKIKRGVKTKLRTRCVKAINELLHTICPEYVSHAMASDISMANIKKFIDANILNRLYPSDMNELRGLDAIVVGSDQVWRPFYCDDVRQNFLDFAVDFKNMKRVSYAASFGVAKLSPGEFPQPVIDECSKLLKLFDAVSVREQDGVNICKERFGVSNAEWVLDPTMLLDADDYCIWVQNAGSGRFINYVLDQNSEKTEMIKGIEAHLGVKSIPVMDDIVLGRRASKVKCCRSVENWLSDFVSADFVFTDSFHGCVFCIIFNKPFAVCVNLQRGGSRFESLLSLYGLKDRMITNASEVPNLMSRKIDWDFVNAKRSNMKNKSLAFLQKALN